MDENVGIYGNRISRFDDEIRAGANVTHHEIVVNDTRAPGRKNMGNAQFCNKCHARHSHNMLQIPNHRVTYWRMSHLTHNLQLSLSVFVYTSQVWLQTAPINGQRDEGWGKLLITSRL
jgi:hypothetical protein